MSAEVSFPITLPVVKDENGNITGAQITEDVADKLAEYTYEKEKDAIAQYCYEANKDKLYEYCKERARQEAQKQAQARQGPPSQGQTQSTDLLNTVTRVIEKILPLKLTLSLVSDLFAGPIDALGATFGAVFQLIPTIFIVIAFTKVIETIATAV